MSLLDRITSFHGRLSDTKIVWLPFLFLKPPTPSTPISIGRMLIMVPCFAAWVMIGWAVKELVTGGFNDLSPSGALRAYSILLLVFALWFNLVTRPLWNRRARQLGESQSTPPA